MKTIRYGKLRKLVIEVDRIVYPNSKFLGKHFIVLVNVCDDHINSLQTTFLWVLFLIHTKYRKLIYCLPVGYNFIMIMNIFKFFFFCGLNARQTVAFQIIVMKTAAG